MIRSKESLMLVMFLVVLAFPCAEAFAGGQPGESGFLSLRLPVGARDTAMGGAGVASAEGASTVFWNPALAAFEAPGTDLLLQEQRWMGLFDKETLALSHRNDLGNFGLFFSGLYADEIDRYSFDSIGIPEGSFAPYQVAIGLSYAHKITSVLSAGVMLKFLHEEIDVYSGSGYAFDFSLAHKAIIDGLWFGASITNMGADFTLYENAYKLPTAIRFGFRYDPQIPLFANRVSIAGDIISPNDGNQKAHIGLEYRLVSALALRAGSKINYESQGVTAGAGFTAGNMIVGYAFEDMVNDIDPSHRFSLELRY
jgi:hypothetical protein